MKKIALIYGLILGGILCTNMFIMIQMMYSDAEFESNDVLGYIFMLVIFSLIFFGIRSYRNKELEGIISFWQAFKIGFLISFVASTMYVVLWLFYYYLFVPDFVDVYTEHVLFQCNGEEEIAAKTEEMKNLKEMYKNPLFVILITYSEVLPLGLIVSLISAFFLKNKKKDSALEATS